MNSILLIINTTNLYITSGIEKERERQTRRERKRCG